ncbi:MAG: alpha/beta fold hydrolase [Bacteroidales bacterium]|nr:alpha/beta fold hydrolase [Bacteroidales bacterium]MCF8389701.1 alpha/beta fold hydrolase [Bacteroidales bacterium]
MNMEFRKFGEGPPLIIAHGLYGASDNWVGIGRELAKTHEVFIIDWRNHGKSPHTPEHNYDLLKKDLLDFINQQNLKKVSLLGHSMGGKACMFFAVDYPEIIQSLIVVDISPRSYISLDQPAPHALDHMNVIQSLIKVDLKKAESRMDIDMVLADTIKSPRIRQFLLKNIHRKNLNNFEWKINLQSLHDNLPGILGGLNPKEINNGKGVTGFPVLFIKGADSDYISDIDYPIIKSIFPVADIVSIPNSGHWVHAEQTELFLKNIKYFLNN